MPNIPDQLDAITPDWLSETLGATVSGVEVLDAHAGTTGRGVIAITTGQGVTGLPDRLFVKLPPNDELQRQFVTSAGMGRREALFYQHLGAEVPVRVPRCYAACSDDSGERYIMLLEHLEDAGCSFNNAGQCYSLEYVRDVVACFARLHAAYWQSPRFGNELSWIEPPMQHEIAVQLVQVALEAHGATMPPVFSRMAELFLTDTDAIYRLWRSGPETLVHGDAHDANLFMDDGVPGFLDWAVLSRAPGMRDVGYFLAGTLKEDERAAIPSLLTYYREQLLANGVANPPSLAELKAQLQWHAAYVWVGATVTLAMGDAWQPVNYVLSSLATLHGALDSLGSVEALREAAR